MTVVAGNQSDGILTLVPPSLANIDAASTTNPMGIGGRYMYSLGLASDALLEKMYQAMLAHMPLFAPPSALGYLGQDRLLVQGPGESNANFALRLQSSFDTWQYAGSSRSVLQATVAYMTGYQGTFAQTLPIASIVSGYRAKKWSWINNTDASDAASYFTEPTQNWSWDGTESTLWWRAWLILYFQMSAPVLSGTLGAVTSNSGSFFTITGLASVPGTVTSPTLPAYLTISGAASSGNNGTFQITQQLSPSSVVIANPDGVASDANNGALTWSISYYAGIQPLPVLGFPGAVIGGNSNQCVGCQFPGTPGTTNGAGFWTTFRSILGTWKSANTWYVNVILRFSQGDLSSGNDFSPWSTEGDGNPEGTWGLWYTVINNVAVQSRTTSNTLSTFNGFVDATIANAPGVSY